MSTKMRILIHTQGFEQYGEDYWKLKFGSTYEIDVGTAEELAAALQGGASEKLKAMMEPYIAYIEQGDHTDSSYYERVIDWELRETNDLTDYEKFCAEMEMGIKAHVKLTQEIINERV